MNRSTAYTPSGNAPLYQRFLLLLTAGAWLAAYPATALAQTGHAYADAVLADNPLVFYRFNEAVGAATAADATGQSRDGTYANVVLGEASARTALGTAATFNNQNSSVAVPALGEQFMQITLEVWLKPNSMVTFDTIYNEDGWDYGWIHSHLGNGSQIEFSLNGNQPVDQWMGGPLYFQNGQWTYVAMVYDSTASTLTLYLNGQPVDTRTYGAANPANLAAAHIGAWNGNDRGFDGMMDEFALYDTALPAERVFAHYLAAVGVAIKTQPLDATVFTNNAVTFNLEAISAGGTLTYQWQKNGVDLPGATQASYTTPLLVLADNGSQYHCVVSAGGNSTTTRDATVTVLATEVVPGPLAWLNFDHTLADQGGSATPHNATFSGNTVFEANVPNATAGTASAKLPGDGLSYVEVAHDADLNQNTGSPYTMTAWIKAEYLEGNRVVLAKSPPDASVIASGSGTHSTALFVRGDGKVVYDLFWVGALVSVGTVPVNQWVHVGVAYDGSNYRLYLNGIPDTTGTMAGANQGANGEEPWEFTIGHSLNAQYPGGDFQGNIDEVAFWNSALSPAQMLGLYTQGLPKVAITVTEQPADAIGSAGGTATFTVKATAVGTVLPVTYQWQKNGANLVGATSPSYTTPALTAADAGALYRCVFHAGPATAASREAMVHVVDNSSPYAAAVLADSPLVYYRFEEPVGFGSALDASPNGQQGLYANVALGSPSINAILGKAGTFNNLNSSVAVPALGEQLAQVTLEVWLRPNSMVTFDTIFNDDGWNSGWIHSHLGNGSQIEFSLNGSDPIDHWMAGPAYFQNGQWTYVVMVYDTVASTLTLYVNGQAIDTRTYNSAIPAHLAAAHIGAWNGNDRAFDGMMDEFALYGTALSASRILAHYGAAGFLVVFSQQPSDTTILAGQSATFSAQAMLTVGAEPIHYQWLKNGVTIAGATNATYQTPALSLAEHGAKFSVAASVSLGSNTSREAVVTVLESVAPPPPLAWLGLDNSLADQAAPPQPHDGTMTGDVRFDAAVANATAGTASAWFGGTGGQISLANAADLNLNTGTSFTIAAWIKTDFDSGNHVILAKSPTEPVAGGDGTHTPALFVDGNGKLVYDVWYVGANVSTTSVRTGNWTHVAVTYDGTHYRFYLNGLPDAITGQYNAQGGANETAGSNWTLTLGQSLNTTYPAGDWAGSIDELAFWQSALSPTQVFTLFVTGLEGAMRPTLQWTWAGDQLTFTWDGAGFKLQQNSELAVPAGWTDVPQGGSSPVNVTMGAGHHFFRLLKP